MENNEEVLKIKKYMEDMYCKSKENPKKTRNKPTYQDRILNIRMKSSKLDEFKEICQKQGLVYSKVVRGLITDYIDGYKKQQRKQNKDV